eukprot:TRINITY_DN974_c0_g1_i1.p1 TRINITY_DN974_c0_g1~~TRINITY_DN974_c0_g1_i1.p1  ORF type:complete len:206 (+),score=12.20 TRINITY_DN974_c0_g1_i1:65-619(+)
MAQIGQVNMDWTNDMNDAQLGEILECNFVMEDPAGACWECWKLEPCCGSPCNPMSGAYCFLCWVCCGCCSYAKLIAHTQDQECGVVNHCLPILGTMLPVVGWVWAFLMYGNVRHQARMAAGQGDAKAWIGDWIVVLVPCTAPCTLCQTLRTVEPEAWDWLGAIQAGKMKGMVDPCVHKPYCIMP